MNITNKQRKELQSWYEKHLSYYEIESNKGIIVIAKNIISNDSYTIRVGRQSKTFKVGHLYFGSLVPWNNEWYWSGSQLIMGETPRNLMDKMKHDFFQRSPQIVYRYYKTKLKKAKQITKVHYENFVKFHGDDLAVFPYGYTMAAALQKQNRLEYEARSEEAVKEVMKKQGLKNPWPDYTYPQTLLESNTGIGVFF